MTHLTYILSNIDKALAFEWVAARLNRQEISLRFILLNPGPSVLETFLQAQGVPVVRIMYRGKKDLAEAIRQIYRHLRMHRTDAVHCHLFDANVAGLLAARLAGVRKRIYTRHHATFHHRYFPRAVHYDRFISRMATQVVAISENVRRVLLREGVPPAKITLIHHGFDLEGFLQPDPAAVARLRAAYLPPGAGPVVGVISRYFELKGIQHIIPAFRRLRQRHPAAHLLLANATGNYKTQIQELLHTLPAGSFTEIGFEKDLFSLYALFDVFVHVPIDAEIEAFGQTYVEALAAGVPSVFTLSGVAAEFVRHRENAWVVPFEDADAVFEAMTGLLENEPLRTALIRNGRRDVQARFGVQDMIDKLEALYRS